MYGYLVPSSGGRSIPLRKTRMFLGRSQGSDAPLSRENAYCQLELIEGFWHVEDLNSPSGVKINGRAVKRDRMMPDDELTIGKHRYRIQFDAPKYSGVGRLAKSSRSKPAAGDPSQKQTMVMDSAAVPAGGGILGRLIPVGGGEEIVLRKPKLTVGRNDSCDVVIPKRSISSMHCGLELVNGYWRAMDLDSRNGIRVNGMPVTKAWVLPKSRLSLAEHRFQLEYTGVGAPPPDAIADERGELSGPGKRSLMDKLGLSETDLHGAYSETENDESSRRRRWDLSSED